MRTVTIFLFYGLLALNLTQAQPAPTLEVGTNREFYRTDARNKVYLEVRVGTTGTPLSIPSPATRNLTFVLDRSGSMAGASIQALRQAMAVTLNSLADRDIVSVVLFGSEVETLIEAKRRDQLGNLDALLAQIEPAGGAALYDALNQAAAQLRRYAGPATINHLILVTDGPPTKGPRELADFTKLAQAFAREGFTFSTIGLSEDFNEDMLATLARIGNGHFYYAAQPEKLTEALQAEIAPQRTLIARDAVLTVEFKSACDEVASYGWKPATIDRETVTYHFPYLFADQELSVLASTSVRAQKSSYTLASVRLRWNDLTEGKTHELIKPVSIQFETDENAIRTSANPAVVRASASTLISEGMQQAIEEIDKGDFRRALRALRRARDDAQSMNYDLDDPQITARIHQLETYLTEVQARGLNQLDRKILRSGLFNQFDTPTEEPKDK